MSGTKVIEQKHDWDCGVAAIAMLLNLPYGDVAKVVRDTIDDPRLKSRGLILRQLEDVIHEYQLETKRVYRKEGYLDGATGILGLNGGTCSPSGHWVVVKSGMILDPSDGMAWDPDDYMTDAKCRPATMVVIT